jgi:uncharacterized protein DUF4242
MSRYVVERTFPDGWHVPADAVGAELCEAIVEQNTDDGVTWVHSYVSADRTRAYCIYDAPSPEAVRRSARRNGLPIDRITAVRLLDPYSFR